MVVDRERSGQGGSHHRKWQLSTSCAVVKFIRRVRLKLIAKRYNLIRRFPRFSTDSLDMGSAIVGKEQRGMCFKITEYHPLILHSPWLFSTLSHPTYHLSLLSLVTSPTIPHSPSTIPHSHLASLIPHLPSPISTYHPSSPPTIPHSPPIIPHSPPTITHLHLPPLISTYHPSFPTYHPSFPTYHHSSPPTIPHSPPTTLIPHLPPH